jgi:DNA-binding MarR family transcriptional regulator
MSFDALKLEYQLCFPIYAAANAMTRAYRPLLEKIGLTYPQYLVMLVLWEKDECSLSEIGEKLRLDSGTLTPLVKRMETNGLLARTRAKEDERRIVVTLTAAGKKLKQAAKNIPFDLVAKTNMKLEDMMTLKDQLTGLIASLSE